MINLPQLRAFGEALSGISNNETFEAARLLLLERQRALQTLNAMAFRVGQRVVFDARSRGIVFGVITKINAKSIKVKATSGMTWKVSPSLLKLDT